MTEENVYNIRIIPADLLDTILPFLQLLNPKTDPALVQQRLDELKETTYQCVGVYHHEKLIAVSGIWILNKIYAGKHIEPDNVAVLEEYRNQGVGELLMNWIHDYAKSIGCLGSELNCYISNAGGIKFWANQGYRIVGFHFIRKFE